LSGIRIIVYYLEDVDLVCQLLMREFQIDDRSSIDKSLLLKPNEFGYRSVHYIASLPETRKNLLEWRSFANIRAEIQVRTVLQHAWASLSHTLDYKHEQDVPSPLRRKLFRLAGLLELSDEEFSGLRKSEQDFSGAIREQLSRGQTDVELNTVSLVTYLNNSKSLAFLLTAAETAGLVITGTNDDTSALIALCTFVGIKTIGQLEIDLRSSKPWAAPYLKDQAVSIGVSWSLNLPAVIELIIIRLYSGQLTLDNLIAAGWDDYVGDLVLRVARLPNQCLENEGL